MPEKMDKKHCSGCYNDDYNRGLGGAKECWSLATAGLTHRRRVGTWETPPWTATPEIVPTCYQQTGFVFVGPTVSR